MADLPPARQRLLPGQRMRLPARPPKQNVRISKEEVRLSILLNIHLIYTCRCIPKYICIYEDSHGCNAFVSCSISKVTVGGLRVAVANQFLSSFLLVPCTRKLSLARDLRASSNLVCGGFRIVFTVLCTSMLYGVVPIHVDDRISQPMHA